MSLRAAAPVCGLVDLGRLSLLENISSLLRERVHGAGISEKILQAELGEVQEAPPHTALAPLTAADPVTLTSCLPNSVSETGGVQIKGSQQGSWWRLQ